jgi:hypothetical protein
MAGPSRPATIVRGSEGVSLGRAGVCTSKMLMQDALRLTSTTECKSKLCTGGLVESDGPAWDGAALQPSARDYPAWASFLALL